MSHNDAALDARIDNFMKKKLASYPELKNSSIDQIIEELDAPRESHTRTWGFGKESREISHIRFPQVRYIS